MTAACALLVVAAVWLAAPAVPEPRLGRLFPGPTPSTTRSPGGRPPGRNHSTPGAPFVASPAVAPAVAAAGAADARPRAASGAGATGPCVPGGGCVARGGRDGRGGGRAEVEGVGAGAVQREGRLSGAAGDSGRGITACEHHGPRRAGERALHQVRRDLDDAGLRVHDGAGAGERSLRLPDGEAHPDLLQQTQGGGVQGVHVGRRRRRDVRDHGTTTLSARGTIRHSMGRDPAISPSVCTSTSLPSSTVLTCADCVRKYSTLGCRMCALMSAAVQ